MAKVGKRLRQLCDITKPYNVARYARFMAEFPSWVYEGDLKYYRVQAVQPVPPRDNPPPPSGKWFWYPGKEADAWSASIWAVNPAWVKELP